MGGKVEVWVETQPGATMGWILSRAMEELGKRESDVPAVVGLKVIKGGASGSSPPGGGYSATSKAPRTGAAGEDDSGLEAEILVDLGQPVEEVLEDGDCLECVFEVVGASALVRSSGRKGQDNVGISDFQIIRVIGSGASCKVVQVKHKK